MNDFRGKVAVVTGAGRGIGRGLAERCAREGMSVVLADVDDRGLDEARAALAASGARALAVPTDVADPARVDALAQRALEAFGQVDVVFNNAGVLLTGYCWERSAADWDWILGVNLRGVINGLRTFVPVLLERGAEAHVVNTASPAGLLPAPFMGPYTVTKHAVLALTETLHYELAALGAPIHVHALCPLNVVTDIMESGAGRPLRSKVRGGPDLEQFEEAVSAQIAGGISPAECAEQVFRGMREGRYWLLQLPEILDAYRRRTADVLAGRNPEFRFF